MGDYIGLKAEDAKTIYDGMSDQDRCNAMNAPGSGMPIYGLTSLDDLKRWMAKQLPNSLIYVMRDYAVNGTDANAKAAAAGLVELLDENVIQFNMRNAKAQSGLAALVSAGVITQSQADEATILGDTPQSIAQNLGFSEVKPGDLEFARTL